MYITPPPPPRVWPTSEELGVYTSSTLTICWSSACFYSPRLNLRYLLKSFCASLFFFLSFYFLPLSFSFSLVPNRLNAFFPLCFSPSCLTQQLFRAYKPAALVEKPQDKTVYWSNIPRCFGKKRPIRSLEETGVRITERGFCAALITLGDVLMTSVWHSHCQPVCLWDVFTSFSG